MVSTLCSRARATWSFSTLLSSSALRRRLPLVGAAFCVLNFGLSNLCLSSSLKTVLLQHRAAAARRGEEGFEAKRRRRKH
ncbi:hypothetical protein SO802_034634 [Lithocarpus litseifolius]|uniref:Uncharacterized protein n=1 Tax=Lithocarpus litseifolius TaxID=425828 RepID=A0AAW2BJE7_9ROSI